jgi:hypothetical protein
MLPPVVRRTGPAGLVGGVGVEDLVCGAHHTRGSEGVGEGVSVSMSEGSEVLGGVGGQLLATWVDGEQMKAWLAANAHWVNFGWNSFSLHI